jgi:hypothetical protein
MGKGKTELPATFKYFEDPNFNKGVDESMGLGGRLTNFDFSGNLSPLQDTININPDVVSGFFQSLQPYYNQTRRSTMNELAATNQLESSTTANRLGQIDTDIASTLQGYTSNLIQQALQNRITLFGTGLNTISGATGLAGQREGNKNQFNLANYENQVAAILAGKSDTGGLFGGLTGAAGGAIIGGLLAAPTGGMSIPIGAMLGGSAGGATGYFGPSGTGGQILSAGAGALGSSFGGGKLPYQPGSTASNKILTSDMLNTTDLSTKYPGLFGGLN